ncbi:MAG: tripartite tricarboxylate transporter substrate-binding protein, partial [Atribacterota bacterium]|nr:tripartite tricarboxylate transporter substrate-binding protein [Atribacterota bacterium]
MYKKERTFILISITILLLISICNFSFAAYPEREVTLLMASSAGGGDDLIAQTFKPYLEKYLGVRTICDYKIGAGMTVAWAYIVNSTKPDGYTLGLTKVPHLAATEIMRKDEKKHKWEDIVPVYNIVVD